MRLGHQIAWTFWRVIARFGSPTGPVILAFLTFVLIVMGLAGIIALLQTLTIIPPPELITPKPWPVARQPYVESSALEVFMTVVALWGCFVFLPIMAFFLLTSLCAELIYKAEQRVQNELELSHTETQASSGI